MSRTLAYWCDNHSFDTYILYYSREELSFFETTSVCSPKSIEATIWFEAVSFPTSESESGVSSNRVTSTVLFMP